MLKVHKSQLLLKANMPILFMEKYLGVIFQKKIKFENQKREQIKITDVSWQ